MRERLLAHLETVRPYTLFHAALVALAGAALAGRPFDHWQSWLLIAGAPTLGWIAALYGCDYLDQDLDRISKPKRPIPSGRMKAKEAFAAMLVALYLGLACAAFLGRIPFLLSGGAMLCGAAYAMALKARGLAGNLVRGMEGGLTFWFGAVAASGGGRVEQAIPLAVMALAYIAHDTATNLIGAIRDREGDRAGGYQTLPVRLGVKGAALVALLFALVQLAVLAYFPMLYRVSDAYRPMLSITALLMVLSFFPLASDGWNPSPHRSLLAHKILVLERLTFSATLIAGAESWRTALTLLLPAAILTFLSQRWLRDRHEYGAALASSPPDAASIGAWVDRTLAAMQQRPLRGLNGWDRRLKICVTDLGLTYHLQVASNQVSPVEADRYGELALPEVQIQTAARSFAALFLHRQISPHRALLGGQVQIRASASDLVRLNALVSEFLNQQGGPLPEIQVRESDVTAEAQSQKGRLVVLADTTLRDGEQMPGVAFSAAQKLAIARRLDGIGVPLIEAGYPAVSQEELKAVQQIATAGLKATVQVIARPVRSDIDLAAESGAQSVALFIGTSDQHLRFKLQLSRDEVLRTIREGVAYARRFPMQVIFAPEDATRTDLPFLLECCRAAVAEGAQAIGIPDTAGVMGPQSMADLVRQVVAALPVPVAVHCHNDFGLATANSLAAVAAGASGVQCSLGGLGERAGNAALEEVAVALEEQMGHPTGIDLAQLTPAVRELYALMDLPVPPNKPVVGRNAFAHESGLHVMGVSRGAATYEPYPPERVGQQRRFVYGKHSGRSAILSALERHRLEVGEPLSRRLVTEVKRRGELGQSLSEEELLLLAAEMSGTE